MVIYVPIGEDACFKITKKVLLRTFSYSSLVETEVVQHSNKELSTRVWLASGGSHLVSHILITKFRNEISRHLCLGQHTVYQAEPVRA